MPDKFNYGASELRDLNPDAERYSVKLRSNWTEQTESAQTKWLGLTPEQYRQVADLIISFGLH